MLGMNLLNDSISFLSENCKSITTILLMPEMTLLITEVLEGAFQAQKLIFLETPFPKKAAGCLCSLAMETVFE